MITDFTAWKSVISIWRRCGTQVAKYDEEDRGTDEGLHLFWERPNVSDRLFKTVKIGLWCMWNWWRSRYMTAQVLFYHPAKEVVKSWVTLSCSTKFFHEDALNSYSAFDQFLLKLYVTVDIIANLNARLGNPGQGSRSSAEFAEELWTKTLGCWSVHDNKLLKPLLMDLVTH